MHKLFMKKKKVKIKQWSKIDPWKTPKVRNKRRISTIKGESNLITEEKYNNIMSQKIVEQRFSNQRVKLNEIQENID